MVDIGAIAAGVKGLVTTVKGVKEAEVKAELLTQLVELNVILLESQEEIVALRERNRELSERLSDRDDYVLESNVYWKGPDKKGPFCPHCGPRGNWVQLSANEGLWFCAVCKNGVPKPGSGLR